MSLLNSAVARLRSGSRSGPEHALSPLSHSQGEGVDGNAAQTEAAAGGVDSQSVPLPLDDTPVPSLLQGLTDLSTRTVESSDEDLARLQPVLLAFDEEVEVAVPDEPPFRDEYIDLSDPVSHPSRLAATRAVRIQSNTAQEQVGDEETSTGTYGGERSDRDVASTTTPPRSLPRSILPRRDDSDSDSDEEGQDAAGYRAVKTDATGAPHMSLNTQRQLSRGSMPRGNGSEKRVDTPIKVLSTSLPVSLGRRVFLPPTNSTWGTNSQAQPRASQPVESSGTTGSLLTLADCLDAPPDVVVGSPNTPAVLPPLVPASPASPYVVNAGAASTPGSSPAVMPNSSINKTGSVSNKLVLSPRPRRSSLTNSSSAASSAVSASSSKSSVSALFSFAPPLANQDIKAASKSDASNTTKTGATSSLTAALAAAKATDATSQSAASMKPASAPAAAATVSVVGDAVVVARRGRSWPALNSDDDVDDEDDDEDTGMAGGAAAVSDDDDEILDAKSALPLASSSKNFSGASSSSAATGRRRKPRVVRETADQAVQRFLLAALEDTNTPLGELAAAFVAHVRYYFAPFAHGIRSIINHSGMNAAVPSTPSSSSSSAAAAAAATPGVMAEGSNHTSEAVTSATSPIYSPIPLAVSIPSDGSMQSNVPAQSTNMLSPSASYLSPIRDPHAPLVPFDTVRPLRVTIESSATASTATASTAATAATATTTAATVSPTPSALGPGLMPPLPPPLVDPASLRLLSCMSTWPMQDWQRLIKHLVPTVAAVIHAFQNQVHRFLVSMLQDCSSFPLNPCIWHALSVYLGNAVYPVLFPLYQDWACDLDTELAKKINELRYTTTYEFGLSSALCLNDPRVFAPPASVANEVDVVAAVAKLFPTAASLAHVLPAYRMAVQEYNRLPLWYSPVEKLQQIVRVSQSICACVDKFQKTNPDKSEKDAVMYVILCTCGACARRWPHPNCICVCVWMCSGADDLLILFAVLIVRGDVTCLHAHLKFIDDMMSDAHRGLVSGYYHATFQAAAELLRTIDKNDIIVPEE
jgi:hypothetical protein